MEDLFNDDITIINRFVNMSTKKVKFRVNCIKGFWSSSKRNSNKWNAVNKNR